MTSRKKIAIVGAGLSGATIANSLAWKGQYDIAVFESRDHVAGNAHTERDPQTGVMLHKYGPHVFHTNNDLVWNFLSSFAKFEPYIQRTKGMFGQAVYSLPINLHTINQFFNKHMNPAQAEEYIGSLVDWDHEKEPANFEELALATVGPQLYYAFLRGYTMKQWGLHPTEVPASVLKRLPLRFNYDDNAFSHKYQGIPRNGYTDMVHAMLNLPYVTVHLGVAPIQRRWLTGFDHIFYSGAIDQWFDYRLGRLPYRTLDFEVIRASGDFQGCAVMNSCDLSTPWTRSTEHKHFTPWEQRTETIVYREFSRQCDWGDIPYYPIRFPKDKEQLLNYQALAEQERGVTFVGRLGTYEYLDMDVTVARALQVAKDFHGS